MSSANKPSGTSPISRNWTNFAANAFARSSVMMLLEMESGCSSRQSALVERHQLGRLALSEVPLQDTRRDRRQIDDHQRVDRVAEVAVDIDAEQTRVQFQVLPQQHRHSF